MARKKTHGKTASGKPITDDLIDKLAEKAEAGYDVDATLRRRPGRPTIGSAPAQVESVRWTDAPNGTTRPRPQLFARRFASTYRQVEQHRPAGRDRHAQTGAG